MRTPDPSRARLRRLLLPLALLAACGGGGGGPGGADVQESIVAASSVAARCRAPRAPTVLDAQGRPYPDRAGTLGDELAWVRAWIDETYLWYQDVRGLDAATRDPARYTSPVDYFDALKSPYGSTGGRPRDAYHYTDDTQRWVALSRSGLSVGYGFEVALVSLFPPRSAVVGYTQPGTPAAAAGIARGAQLLRVDGVDLVNESSAAGIDALNAGLFPSGAGPHTFTIQDAGSSVPRTVTLNATPLPLTPVMGARTLPAPYQHVGYLQFNDHIATAEAPLVEAFGSFAGAGISELVLDMRYNGGGSVDLASELAFMIAGAARTGGKVFEELVFNDRNPFNLSDSQRRVPFHDRTRGFSVPAGQPLPQLNLERVYVLAGPGTCSASEAVINGLRGVGVGVVQVGGTTCGKPYGFFPTDNCGTTYFSIQFRGLNDQGVANYVDGFEPRCPVADDFERALGDPQERVLAAALSHQASGRCTPVVARAQAARAASGIPGLALQRPPARANRFYGGTR